MGPTEFGERFLGLSYYDWQIEAMEYFALGDFVVLVSGNGSGKTSRVLVTLVYWFLNRFPRGRFPIMSGDNRQISSILWPALESHQASFPHLTFQKNLTRTREGGDRKSVV